MTDDGRVADPFASHRKPTMAGRSSPGRHFVDDEAYPCVRPRGCLGVRVGLEGEYANRPTLVVITDPSMEQRHRSSLLQHGRRAHRVRFGADPPAEVPVRQPLSLATGTPDPVCLRIKLPACRTCVAQRWCAHPGKRGASWRGTPPSRLSRNVVYRESCGVVVHRLRWWGSHPSVEQRRL